MAAGCLLASGENGADGCRNHCPEACNGGQVQPSECKDAECATIPNGTASSLSDNLFELAEAERTWGPDSARAAVAIRRLAFDLEKSGKTQQALPLWLRVLEIELQALGSTHPDVLNLVGRIRNLMGSCCLSDDAVEAFESRIPDAFKPEVATSFPSDAKEKELPPPSSTSQPLQRNDGTDYSRLAASGVALASNVGGTVVGQAINLSFHAANAAGSVATDTAGSVATYAARTASVYAVRSVVPTHAVEPAIAVANWAAVTASRTALGTAKVASSAVWGVTHTVSVAAGSTFACAAISYAGSQAVSGVASAYTAWGNRCADRTDCADMSESGWSNTGPDQKP